MGRPERIVFALGPLGQSRKPPTLPQRTDAVAAARQNLVGIGLVADVPDQPVSGRIEHIMNCDGELDDPETSAQMAAGHGNGADGLLSQLIGKLPQLGAWKLAQGRRLGHLVKQWRFGSCHSYRLTSALAAHESPVKQPFHSAKSRPPAFHKLLGVGFQPRLRGLVRSAPFGLGTIFSSRLSADRSFCSQWPFRAWPRSYRTIESSRSTSPCSSLATIASSSRRAASKVSCSTGV